MTGAAGPTSASGQMGMTGATGPTGPTGQVSQAYASYKMDSQTMILNGNSQIRFVNPSFTSYPQKNIALTTLTLITVPAPGDYLATMQAYFATSTGAAAAHVTCVLQLPFPPGPPPATDLIWSGVVPVGQSFLANVGSIPLPTITGSVIVNIIAPGTVSVTCSTDNPPVSPYPNFLSVLTLTRLD